MNRAELLENRCLLTGSSTFGTATPLDVQAFGQVQTSSSLASGSDSQLFSVSLEAGQAVTVDIDAEAEGSPLDALVRVFSPAGEEIVSVDNLTTRNERPLDPIQLDPALAFHAQSTGVWFIGVSSSGNDAYDPNTGLGTVGNSSGSFTLTVALDSGETTETATPINISEGEAATLTESIAFAGDRDSHRIDLLAGQVIEAVLQTDGHTGDLLGRLELYGPDVSFLAVEDAGYGDAPVIVYRVTNPGSYYFDVVSTRRQVTTGDYDITFRILSPSEAPQDTVGDTISTATSVAIAEGETVIVPAEIEFNNDADLFALDLTEGQRLTLDVDAFRLVPFSELDSALSIFDAAGEELRFNDDVDIVDPALTFTAPHTGRFIVGVSGTDGTNSTSFDPFQPGTAFSFSRGRYNLNFSLARPDNPNLRFTSTDAPAEVAGGITQFAIDVALDFAVQDVNVELSQDILASNLTLTLISPAGTRVVLADSPGFFGETYDGVTFDDEASSVLLSTFGTHSGRFLPDQELAVLDGESSAGIWLLEVEVDGFAFGPVTEFTLQLEPTSVFTSSQVPVEILSSTTVTSELEISDEISIADLDVELDITHTYDADLQVFLISPSGTRVKLFADIGYSEQNFTGTILDDEADISILSGSGPFSGRFQPEGNLSDFDGELTSGTWTLEITDTFDLDDGILNSWSLTVVPGTTGNAGGTVFLDLDQNGTLSGPEPGLAGVTVFVDADQNGQLDDGELSTVTDSTGAWRIRDLEPGVVYVVAETPAGLTPTSSAQIITVATGATSEANLGFAGPATIRGTVFTDRDGSGTHSIGEPGLAGRTVFIDSNANGVHDADEPGAVTDASGSYSIAGLTPGVHLLSLTGNLSIVSPADNRLFVTTAAGQVTESADFALLFTSASGVGPVPATGEGLPDDIAASIAPTTTVYAGLRTDDVDTYEVTILESGRLQLRTDPTNNSLTTRIRLLTDAGRAILVGTSSAPTTVDATIDVHLAPGQYRVEVSAENGATGGYTLKSDFVPTASPDSAIVPEIPVRGYQRESVVAADFNGDGIPDLASADIRQARLSVLLGVGDGSFRDAYSLAIDAGPRFLTVSDLNNDGVADLLSANGGLDGGNFNNTVSVFLGIGNGTFQPEYRIQVGVAPRELTTSDFNGDGVPDVATANFETDDVSILIGQGDGTFQEEFRVDVGTEPESLTAADLNGDASIDLAVANRETGTISILLGDGIGHFVSGPDAVISFSSLRPQSVRQGDVNRDGIPDLVVTNEFNFVNVLIGIGNGRFQPAIEIPVGEDSEMVLLEDLTGDGVLDLATANRFSNDVSVRIGTGIGADPFGPETRIPVEFDPVMLVAGDLNLDGLPDIAVANRGDVGQFPDGGDGSVSLILNRGGGVFQSASATRLLTGDVPTTIQIADFDNDGRPDIVTANQSATRTGGSVTVLTGLGTGIFDLGTLIDQKARSLAVGDLNQDGRDDIVSVNGRDVGLSGGYDYAAGTFVRAEIPGSLSVFLGLGNGEFEMAGQFDVGMNAISVALADLNGDGILDAVTVNEFPDTDDSSLGSVSVLIGNGDGTFIPSGVESAGIGPSSVIAEDLDGDGNIDLAVANRGEPFDLAGGFGPGETDNRIFIFWGNGDGTFLDPQVETVGDGPKELIAVDLNLDGVPELVTANRGARGDFFGSNDTISILSPSAAAPRQFAAAIELDVPNSPTDLISGDFNGDGLPDLAITGSTENVVGVLLGRGGLSFETLATIPLGSALQPESIDSADLNSDGVLDLTVANLNSDDVSVLLGVGDGSFVAADQLANLVEQSGPHVADVNRDGIDDVLTIDQHGQIIVRAGRDSPGGLLAPPFVLNPDSPAKSIETFAANGETLVAAVSRDGRTLRLYGFDNQESPEVRLQTDLPGFAQVLVTGDVTGDSVSDIVATLPLDGQIVILRSNAAGGVATPERLDVGLAPVAVTLSDLNGSSSPDIIVTSRDTGVAHVFLNDGQGNFAEPFVYSVSDGPSVLGSAQPELISLSRPSGQVVAEFTGDGETDLLVVNQSERSFQLLNGVGDGSLMTARSLVLPETSLDEAAFGCVLLARDSTGDRRTDQIIATAPGASAIEVLNLRDSNTLVLSQHLAVQAGVAGISFADMNGDGLDDLLVNTSTGDLIIFPGQAGGGFGEFFRTQSTVPIAVRDLDGDGRPDVITANSGFDRVSIDFGADAQADAILTENDAPFASPGAVELGDINGDGLEDLIVANTGGNEVFLFPRLSAQSFATEPIVLFSGTNPAGVTIDDVNADGMNDLVVANRGSNDVTIFLGTTTTATGFDDGRRLAVGTGPVSTDVMRDSTTGAITGLVVTNADAGTVSQLPATAGLSGSIFNDQTASVLNIGQTSGQGGQLIGNSFFAANPVNGTFVFIPDLTNSFATGLGISTYDAQGSEPSFLLTTDFNFDGFLDLIVANSGDGTVSLFAGDGIGFLFSDLLAAPSLAHPAAMDIAEVDGVLNLFVTDEGEDVATVFQIRRKPVANLSGLEALSSRLPDRGWWQQLTALFAGTQTRRSREFGDLPDQPGERTDAELMDALPENFWQTLGDGIRTIYRQIRTAPSLNLLRGPGGIRGLTFGFRLLKTVFRDSVLRSIPVPWPLMSPVSEFLPGDSDRAAPKEPNRENGTEGAPTEPQKSAPDGAAERPAPGDGPGAPNNQQTVWHDRGVVPAGFARLASELPIRSQALLAPTASLLDSPATDSLFAATVALFSIGGITSPGSTEEIWHPTDDCEPTSHDQSSPPRRRRPWEEWPSRNAPLPRYWPWAS